MKQTFKNIADNNSKTGRGRKHWDYFDIFKDLFADCATVTLDNVSETQSADVEDEHRDERSMDERPLAQTPVNHLLPEKKEKASPQGRFRAD